MITSSPNFGLRTLGHFVFVNQLVALLKPGAQSSRSRDDHKSACSRLWRLVEVIIGCIRGSRLLASVRCFATVSGGFTTFRLQALDARNVLHHTVTGVTGRGQQ